MSTRTARSFALVSTEEGASLSIVYDEHGEHERIKIKPHQLLRLVFEASHILWNGYNVEKRHGLK